jgi:hypothetical protein
MQRLDDVLAAPVPSRAPTKEHLLLKAAIVTADKGTFDAIISTETPDREKTSSRRPAWSRRCAHGSRSGS